MKLERLAVASSLALLGGFLVKIVFKARVRLQTMAIGFDALQALLREEAFESLHFNPFYDNRTLAKDVVSLEAYKKITTNERATMPKVLLDGAGKGDVFGNEKDYSAYRLTKANIETIIAFFGDIPEVAYVLFVPEPYREDNDYFSYRIIPADKAKQPLASRSRVTAQNNAVMEPVMQGNESEGEVQTRMFAITSARAGVLYMDPSPPATAGFNDL